MIGSPPPLWVILRNLGDRFNTECRKPITEEIKN